MNKLLAKFTIAGVSSLAVVESVSLEPIWNAIVTLCISIISVLMVEGVQLLRKYLQKKIKDLDKKSKHPNDNDLKNS